MVNLPEPEIYELEFKYMPWGILINQVITEIIRKAPMNGTLVDLMCGNGYLLNEVHKKRKDLNLEGIDINEEFIQYAKEKNSNIIFTLDDVLKLEKENEYDIVVSTGGLHHLHYYKQPLFIEKIYSMLKKQGFAILGDPYIDDYSNEKERQFGCTNLGIAYTQFSKEKNAPIEIMSANLEIINNDVNGLEFKTSIAKIKPILKKYFSKIEINKAWPDFKSQFGDYYILCRK